MLVFYQPCYKSSKAVISFCNSNKNTSWSHWYVTRTLMGGLMEHSTRSPYVTGVHSSCWNGLVYEHDFLLLPCSGRWDPGMVLTCSAAKKIVLAGSTASLIKMFMQKEAFVYLIARGSKCSLGSYRSAQQDFVDYKVAILKSKIKGQNTFDC